MRRTDYKFIAVVCLLVTFIYLVSFRRSASIVDLRPIAKSKLQIVTSRRPVSCNRDAEGRIKSLVNEGFQVSVIVSVSPTTDSVVSQTIYSLVAYSDPRLLKEIIIANHGDEDDPKFALLVAEFRNYSPIVKVMASPSDSRMHSKLLMGHVAEGNIVIFLDDNVVVSEGYLLPMIDALKANKERIAVPAFNYLTEAFGELPNQEESKWVFDWQLTIHPYEMHFQDLSSRDETEAFPTAVFDGSAFAVHRTYMEKLGSLKHGMEYLSSIDLSFSAWLCGAGAYVIPCSRVGKYGFESNVEVLSASVKYRIASHYFSDHYMEIFKKANKDVNELPADSENERNNKVVNLHLHKRLCTKTFDDYMSEDVVQRDVYVPKKDVVGFGKFTSINKNSCFRQDHSMLFLEKPCLYEYRGAVVELLESGLMRMGTDCLQKSGTNDTNNEYTIIFDYSWFAIHDQLDCMLSDQGYIVTDVCNVDDEQMQWKRTEVEQFQMRQKTTCISHATDPYEENNKRQVLMTNECDNNSPFQKWTDFIWLR